MIDRIGEVVFWGSFVFPPAAAGGFFYLLKRKKTIVRLPASASLGISLFIVMTQAWTSIFYRDGLAPGLQSSSGWEAILRSLDVNVMWILVALGFLCIGVFLATSKWGNLPADPV